MIRLCESPMPIVIIMERLNDRQEFWSKCKQHGIVTVCYGKMGVEKKKKEIHIENFILFPIKYGS